MDQKNLELAVNLRHELHAHPELSMQEVWTKHHLIEFLKKYTSLEIMDRGRWFYAIYHGKNSEKNIAFRADMDALPIDDAKGLVPYCSTIEGRGHKCGHDGHSAALAGFALELEKYGSNNNIFLLFQHAEETGQGAEECLPFLEENRIDEIYAVHNMPGISLSSVAAAEGVVQFASVGMTLHFLGKKSHACYPENGINPSVAISEVVLALDELRKKQNYKGMTLITIIQINIGEHAFGTNAGEGELLLTVRGAYVEELDDLLAKIEELAKDRADAHGLQLCVSYEDKFADCFNHKEAVDKIRNAAKTCNIPLEDLEEPFRASEDFGRFTKVVPGAIFYVGDGKEHAPLHTIEYDFPDEIIETIVDMYAEISK